MKKITVKRFLQKRLKPIEVYDDLEDLGYYLYYSITYNRKTQHVRSLTGAVMTERAFNYLEEKGSPLNYETNYQYSEYHNLNLTNELNYIRKAVNYIIESSEDKNNLNIFDEFFIPTLREYFESLETTLYRLGWLKPLVNVHFSKNEQYFKKEYNEEYERLKELYSEFEHPISEVEELFFTFNKERNLIAGIRRIEKIFKIEIEKYFHKNTIKYWYLIDLVLKFHTERAMKIDFLLDFNEKGYKKMNENLKYPLSNREIEIFSKFLKDRAIIY